MRGCVAQTRNDKVRHSMQWMQWMQACIRALALKSEPASRICSVKNRDGTEVARCTVEQLIKRLGIFRRPHAEANYYCQLAGKTRTQLST